MNRAPRVRSTPRGLRAIGPRIIGPLLLAGLLGACAAAWQTEQPVTPSSYGSARGEIPRNVGLLRRLAVLGIERAPPKVCADHRTNGEISVIEGPSIAEVAFDFVSKSKDYELLRLDPARHARWLKAPDNAPFLAELASAVPGPSPTANQGTGAVPATASADGTVGPALRALLVQLREAEKADGLLVLFLDRNCPRGNQSLRTVIGVFSLGTSELMGSDELDTPFMSYRAAIFETARAVPVWRHGINEAEVKSKNDFNFFAKARSWFEHLFGDLEPALPGVLTR